MENVHTLESDRDFIEELDSSLYTAGFKSCYTCGTCTAGCPVHRAYNDYDPLRVIRMLSLGLKIRLLKGDLIWLCSDCYTCQENCPMGIRITDIINHLKNLATIEGNAPDGVKIQGKLLRDQGKIYVIDEFDNKKRSKAGLPLLPAINRDATILLKNRER